MPRLIMYMGLPASWKSTKAKQMVYDNSWQWKRINKDDLRAMLDNSQWTKDNEKYILRIRNIMIRDCLASGLNVIVDDTNLDPKHELTLRKIAEEYNAEFEIIFFNTPLWKCIERDSQREKPVWVDVIMNMYKQYLQKKVEYNPDLPSCIIVDIDWTLAIKWDRSIYDDTKLHLDTVCEPVKSIITNQKDIVFIVSGRQDRCKEATEKRLKDNWIEYQDIFMRKTWDERDDTVVKKEIYNNYIKWWYNVKYCIDDRKRIKYMRVEEWLFVFDVNQFDIHF